MCVELTSHRLLSFSIVYNASRSSGSIARRLTCCPVNRFVSFILFYLFRVNVSSLVSIRRKPGWNVAIMRLFFGMSSKVRRISAYE